MSSNTELRSRFSLALPGSFAVAFLLSCSGAIAAGTPPTPAEVAALEASWPKNDLERQLIGAANDPAKRPDFIRALLHADLCALTDKVLPPGADRSNGTDRAKLMGVTAPDGDPATPLFTAPERAAETFGAGTPILCAKGEVLLDSLRGKRVVLDPGQPWGFVWTSDDVEHILGTPRTITRDTPVEYSLPDKAPAALVSRLREALGATPDIKSAWLALAYWPQQKESSWYLEVHTTMDRDKVNALVRDLTEGIDMGGNPMDVAVFAPDAPPGPGMPLLQQ